MLNMNEKLNDRLETLKDLGKNAVKELVEIRKIIADWCSEALTALLTKDKELQEICLNQANQLVAPQSFEDFDEAYHIMNSLCQEFTDNIAEFWTEFDAMTVNKLIGIPLMCPHCHWNIDETDEYCPQCGQHLGAVHKYEEPQTISMKVCACGRRHHSEDRFCPSCGKFDEQKHPVKRGDGL